MNFAKSFSSTHEIIISFKDEQLDNAELPIYVTLLGMVTDVRLEQP